MTKSFLGNCHTSKLGLAALLGLATLLGLTEPQVQADVLLSEEFRY